MINVSNEFRKLMNERTDFKEYAEITFADGTFLELSAKDFTVTNNGVVDAAGSNGIPLGVALCRNIQIELMNDDERFSAYDFFGAKIRLFLTFQLSETEERIEYGTFTVLTPETYGETVIITALDDMYRADKPYNTTLVYPATLGVIWADACNGADIQQGTTTFLNDDFVVNEKPTDITYRQLFGYIAMLAGGNARIDTTGRLRIITYDFEKMENTYESILKGGKFAPWDNPVNLDGGTFNPWNEGDSVDGGVFGDRNDIHVLGNWGNLKVDTDDVVITGISTVYTDNDNNELTAMYGTEGYVLQIENPLIAGQEETAVDLIGNVMVGGRFRQFSGDMVSDPTCEFMDHALILDRKGNVYISYLTDINFQFFGFTNLKNSAETALRNSSQYYSDATQTLKAARKLVAKERTARERAVAQLAKDLANSSGLFSTQEEQADGSIIYYMHDKPTLAESMIIWKLTTLAFGISTDGGKTYPYGFTVDGEEIIRLLYAEGIDVKNLVVGENVIMGENAKISWLNVLDKPEDLAYTDDIPTNEQITQITKDTVTTSYVNSLKVKAASVDAENITGTVINGKKYISNEVIEDDLTFRTTIDGGTITSELIGDYEFKSQLNQYGLTVTSGSGLSELETVVKYSSIEISSYYYNSVLEDNLIKLKPKSGDYYTEITSSIFKQRSSYDNYTEIDGAKILAYSGNYDYTSIEGSYIQSYKSTSDYTSIEGRVIQSYSGTSNYTKIDGNLIQLYGGTYSGVTIKPDSISFSGTSQIKYSSTTAIEITSSDVRLKQNNTFIGKSGGYLGFFGESTKSTKKTVSKASTLSSVEASAVATVVNNLIDALKAYNLIG